MDLEWGNSEDSGDLNGYFGILNRCDLSKLRVNISKQGGREGK